jgi:hypothetical protein
MFVDPLADFAPDWTPYRYGFNNPILYTDPDGMFESKEVAEKYAKDHDIKTGFLRNSKIVENSDGTWSIDNKKAGSSISDYGGDLGVKTSALVIGERVDKGQSPAVAMGTSALVVSQTDSPVLGPSDVVAVGMLLYAGYLALNPPMTTTIADPGVVFSKKASDAGKNEAHGDGGRAASKAEKHIEQLQEQAKSATGKVRKQIEQRIKNIRKDAAKKRKGENHSQTGKR